MNIIEQIIKKEKVRGMKQFICGDLKFRYTSFKEKELVLPKKIKSDALADLIEKKNKIEIKINNKRIIQLREENEYVLKKKIEEKNIEKLEEYKEENKNIMEEIENLEKINENLLAELHERNDEFENFIYKLGITKKVHGFSGLIFGDKKVILTLHTSKKQSPVWGMPDNNIEIREDSNPIIFVNKPFILEIEDLKNMFKIYDPEQMLNNLRYGINNKEDMAYYSYRALWKSMSDSNTITEVKFINETNKEFIEIIKNQNFEIGINKLIKTPAMYEADIGGKEICERIVRDIVMLEKNKEARDELINIVKENYELIK